MANKQKILKLLDEGKTFSQVAERYGLTRNQVAGIKFRARKGREYLNAYQRDYYARNYTKKQTSA